MIRLTYLSLLVAWIPLAAPLNAQDNAVISALTDSNAILKNEISRLSKVEEENVALKERIEELEAELARLKPVGKAKTKDKKDEEPKEDLLVLGTTWTGKIDGRNSKEEFHTAATATIVARTEDAFQIRTIHGGVEWLWDCKRDGRVYRVSKAELRVAPPNFPVPIGLARVNSSEIVIGNVKGTPRLKLSYVRPDGVTGTFLLDQDK